MMEKLSNVFVCERHFLKGTFLFYIYLSVDVSCTYVGKPAYEMCMLNVDWSPSLHLGLDT